MNKVLISIDDDINYLLSRYIKNEYKNEHSYMSLCGLKQEIRTAYSAYARHTEIAARAPPLTQRRQWT